MTPEQRAALTAADAALLAGNASLTALAEAVRVLRASLQDAPPPPPPPPPPDAEQVAARLLALAGQVPLTKPRNSEWVVAKLGEIFVTTDGVDVFVTEQDLK